MFRIEMKTDNAAFGEMPEEKVHEIKLILEDLADWIHCQGARLEDLKDGVPLYDTNENKVGKAIYTDEE